MPKMNNLGMTLIEMIICLSLMSVVILVMYGLISQLNNLESSNGYALQNQDNRLEIIKTIEQDLIETKLIDITIMENHIDLEFSNGNTGYLKYYQIDDADYIEYVSSDLVKYKWKMKDVKIDYQNSKVCFDNVNENESILIINIQIDMDNNISNSLNDIFVSVPVGFEKEYNCT